MEEENANVGKRRKGIRTFHVIAAAIVVMAVACIVLYAGRIFLHGADAMPRTGSVTGAPVAATVPDGASHENKEEENIPASSTGQYAEGGFMGDASATFADAFGGASSVAATGSVLGAFIAATGTAPAGADDNEEPYCP